MANEICPVCESKMSFFTDQVVRESLHSEHRDDLIKLHANCLDEFDSNPEQYGGKPIEKSEAPIDREYLQKAIDSVLFSLALIVGGMAFSSTLEAKKFEEITYEQTLEIKKGSASEYTSASGEEFSVGQEIILRSPANGHQTYTYVFLRAFAMPPLPVSSAWNGTRLKIDKILWKQVQGVPHVVLNTSAQGANFGARKQMIGNLEAAFETREVVTSADEMRPVSEETPMEKLKKAKELLDLEVITQDEYDEIKKSLIPLIL